MLRSTALVCEESGEALQAALDLTRTTIHRNREKDLADLLHLHDEVEQTASLSLMLLVNINREIKRLHEAIKAKI